MWQDLHQNQFYRSPVYKYVFPPVCTSWETCPPLFPSTSPLHPLYPLHLLQPLHFRRLTCYIQCFSEKKKPTLETETYLYFVKFVTIYSVVMCTLYGRDWQNIFSLRWLQMLSYDYCCFFLRSPVKLYTSFPISIRSMVMLFKWPSQFDAIQEEMVLI